MTTRKLIDRALSLEEAHRTAPAGFHVETRKWHHNGVTRILIVRDGFRSERCPGAAHTNAHIDNCGLCLGFVWGCRAVRITEPVRDL